METIRHIVSVTGPGPSIDPGPPRLLASIYFTNGRSRLGLFSTFVDLSTSNPAALPRLEQRRGLLPFFF
jgi:hypothetical protein